MVWISERSKVSSVCGHIKVACALFGSRSISGSLYPHSITVCTSSCKHDTRAFLQLAYGMMVESLVKVRKTGCQSLLPFVLDTYFAGPVHAHFR